MKKYVIVVKETGEELLVCESRDEARRNLNKFEYHDLEMQIYKPNYYAIKVIQTKGEGSV